MLGAQAVHEQRVSTVKRMKACRSSETSVVPCARDLDEDALHASANHLVEQLFLVALPKVRERDESESCAAVCSERGGE